jgi:fused signal recognition particle receptor
MFDGLREKLGSFTRDVEEAAEVEELEDEEIAELDEDPVESDGEATGPGDDPESETDDGPPIEPGDEPAEGEHEASAEVDATPEEPAFERSSEGIESAPEAGLPAAEVEPDTEPTEPDTEPAGEESIERSETDVGRPETDVEDGGEREGEETDEVGPESEESERDGDEETLETDDGSENGPGFAQRAKAAALGRVVIDEERLEEPLWELEMALLGSDVEMGVAEEILDRVREELIGETRTVLSSTGQVVEEALSDAIYEVISVGQFDFDERIEEAEKPVVIVFTGVNGVGKTTSIAKLSRYLEERGYSSVLANGDTYRAGANEQIREHAERLDRKLIAHEQGSDPTAVIYDAVEYAKANGIDVVLGDTAGRLHTDRGLMDQLAKIDRVVGPDMVLFVDEAVAGQDAVSRAREFNEASAIDGAILSKADADSQGGAAISIAHVTGKPILFLGTGQGYDDVVRFDPEEMVDRLLGEEP